MRSFALFLLAMVMWQAGVTGAAFTSNPEVARWSYRLAIGLGSTFGLFYFQFTRDLLALHTPNWILRGGYLLAIPISTWTLAGGPHVIEAIYRSAESGLWVPRLGFLTYPMGLYLYGFLIFGLVNLVGHLRSSYSTVDRNRTRYLLLGLVLVLVGSLVNYSPTLKAYPIDIVANVLNAALIAYVIRRYRLLDITVVIRSGLAYSIPTAIIGAGYFIAIFLAVNLLHFVTGYQALLLSTAMAVFTAVILEPVRDTMQSRIDRLFFREKYDANRMLQDVSRASASVLDLKQLTNMLLDEITATMRVEKAALFLKQLKSGEFYMVAQRGLESNKGMRLANEHPVVAWLSRAGIVLTRHDLSVNPQFKGLWREERDQLEATDAELFIGLRAWGELIGLFVFGPKLSGMTYDQDEQRVLETLANHTAVAIQNAWLHQEVVREKEMAETIVSQALAGIVVTDHSMRVVSLNPQAETITGYSAEEVVDKYLPDVFLLRGSGDGGDELVHRAWTTEELMGPTEAAISGKTGEHDILLGITPFGEGHLFSFADISQLKKVERLKSNIVANVSHELRAPLASIKAYTELLLDNLDEEDRALRNQFLAIIDHETDRLISLIGDLLDLSRLEAGEVEVERSPLHINDVVDDVISLLEVQARERNVTFSLDLPTELPAIVADRQLTTILIKNLISNAVKFSREGGCVNLVVREEEEHVVLDVVDRGIGIPSEDLPHIFDKFYRARSATQAGIGGSGLGLALAREATEIQGGTIDVASELGMGTHVTVVLPINGHAMDPDVRGVVNG